MKKFITWMLACLVLVSTIAGTATNAQAATVSQNNPVNGDYSYYAVYGTIYRVNNQTGKNTKIKELKDAFEIFDLTYSKGYLYFTENLYYGTEMEKNQICRMKTDGSGYEVLGWGQTLSIYKDKIYYIKNKVVTDVYGSSTEAVGIAKMDLNGKNKKDINKMPSDSSSYYRDLTVVNGRIYYIDSKYSGKLISTNMSGKDKKFYDGIDSYWSGLKVAGNKIYYMDQGCRIYYFDTKSKKKKQVCSIPNGDGNFSGVIGENVYYYCYDKQATYCYNMSAKKTTKLIDRKVTLLTTKGEYVVVDCALSQKEFEKTGKTNEIAIMKKSGKGYKKLIRYYVS